MGKASRSAGKVGTSQGKEGWAQGLSMWVWELALQLPCYHISNETLSSRCLSFSLWEKW